MNLIKRLFSHADTRQWFSFAVSAIVCSLLLCAFPYSEGYAAIKLSLFHNWRNITGQGEDWQHCFLVLPIAVFIFFYSIYNKRVPSDGRGGFFFLPLIVLSLILYWLGYRISTHYIGFFAVQFLFAGIIGFLLGWRAVQFFIFPIIFLTFAWPLPFLDNVIAFPLRMLMSNAAVGLLQTLGIDVVRNGTGILSAPDTLLGVPAGKKFAVDVADPCSGIRSLFALMMVSALYAHFTLKTAWQKWILFLCSAPLAILGNLARIVMLTIGTIAFGAEFAIGKNALTDPSWFHMGAGYLVFAVALAGMVGVAWVLNRVGGIAVGHEKTEVAVPQNPPGSARGGGQPETSGDPY